MLSSRHHHHRRRHPQSHILPPPSMSSLSNLTTTTTVSDLTATIVTGLTSKMYGKGKRDHTMEREKIERDEDAKSWMQEKAKDGGENEMVAFFTVGTKNR